MHVDPLRVRVKVWVRVRGMGWGRDYSEDEKRHIILKVVSNYKLNRIFFFAYLPILEKYF